MMRRRNFLRATLVSAGAILVGTGCGTDDASSGRRATTPGESYFPQSIASGDPKPDSVILWARVEDAARAGEDLSLEVEVALDEAFTSLISINGQERLAITATAASDNCVKVKVKGLSPGTVYYYRFIYSSGETFYASRTGRTKTAPAPEADAVVRFAFVSCQDFNGRYYNSHLELANQEVDFVIHLGDYVYETTGDPSFQDPTAERGVKFSDAAGAIAFDVQEGTYYAAKSLSNYRELYKTYRGDAQLQRVHERFPMIITWDDHEYSNDCHGAVAAYYNDAKDELDETRRKNANQAWFEFMPIDYADEAFVYDPAAEYKSDIKIYRDFTFGKHVHLVMTDLRTYRADHIVPEGAYPGAIAVDQTTLAGLGLMASIGFPYVSIDAPAYADYKKLLTDVAKDTGYDPANIKGNISVDYINSVIAKTMSLLAPIDDPAAERGLAFLHLGKMSPNSSLGSRYLVIKDTFDLYGVAKFNETKGASEVVMGDEQEKWFLSTIEGSKSTWKIWGNEYSLIPFQVDLTQLDVPALFKQRFYFNVDAWDGFRNKRSELLGKLSAVSNVVAVTGDIHAFYAGVPNVNNDLSKHIVEFVGGSISSSTFREELLSQIASDPGLATIVGLDQLAKAVDDLMLSTETKVNPHLAFAKSDKNGFVVVEVSASEVVATYHMIPSNDVKVDYSKEGGISAKVSTERFKTVAGEGSLYREIDGAWKRWDTATLSWT